MMLVGKFWFRVLLIGALWVGSVSVSSCASLSGAAPGADVRTVEDKADYHCKLATGLIYEKRVIAALREVEVALSYDPTHAKAHYLKGFIYMGRRNYAEAEVHFHRTIGLNPKLLEAHNALAGTYIALKRWQDALDAVDTLLKNPINPTPWLAHNNAGWAHHKLGNRRQAIYHLKMALMLKPVFCLGYYNLGLVLKDSRRYDSARRRFEQGHRQCPKHAPTLLELGDIYLATANNQKARDAFENCVDLAGGSLIGDRCARRRNALP